MKLTNAQRYMLSAESVIRRKDSGLVIVHLKKESERAYKSTFECLYRRGLIHRTMVAGNLERYDVSPEGRAALEASHDR